MKLFLLIMGVCVATAGGIGMWYFSAGSFPEVRFSDIEAGFENISEEFEQGEEVLLPKDQFETLSPTGMGQFSRWGRYWREFSEGEKKFYENWKRPEGPLQVGVQVGHWKNNEVPEELSGLKRNGGGASGGGKSEWEAVLAIAQQTKILLEARGIVVDLLSATIPVGYSADAFMSIHADGNGSAAISGFKIAGPRRDFSGRASALVSALYESYGRETGLDQDTNVTRRMSGYYAFNWRRYEHAIHPMTPAVIIETGFMTSPDDRAIIIDRPDRAAKGIADGIINFLL